MLKNNIYFSEKLGKYLVHTSYLYKYYKKGAITIFKKYRFKSFIMIYYDNNSCELIKLKCKRKIDNLNNLVEEKEVTIGISK